MNGLAGTRVLVVGSGAIGGVTAAHLRHAGVDVTSLVTNAQTREALLRSGYRLRGHTSLRQVPDPRILERAADVVVWCCDEAPGFAPSRLGDKTVVANIVEAMRRYAAGELGEQPIPFNAMDRIIAIGSDGMMNAVARARHSVLQPYVKPQHVAIGSINSPMQCMMKEICAQCLQRHVDPETGAETIVFSCFNQDQPLDRVDFAGLRQRLTQNGAQEKLTAQWIDRALRQNGLRS